eukprot:403331523
MNQQSQQNFHGKNMLRDSSSSMMFGGMQQKSMLLRPNTSQASFSQSRFQTKRQSQEELSQMKQNATRFYQKNLENEIENTIRPLTSKSPLIQHSKAVGEMLRPQANPKQFFEQRVVQKLNHKSSTQILLLKNQENKRLIDEIANKQVQRTVKKFIKDTETRKDYIGDVIKKIVDHRNHITTNFRAQFIISKEQQVHENYLSNFIMTQNDFKHQERKKGIYQSMQDFKYVKYWENHKSSTLCSEKLGSKKLTSHPNTQITRSQSIYFFGNAKLAPYLLNQKNEIIDYEKSKFDSMNRIKHFKPKEIHIDEEIKIQNQNDLLVRQVACGRRTGYLLFGNGDLYSFGEGTQGQIGNGNSEYKVKKLEKVIGFDCKVKQITSGRSHTLAIDEYNECYTWGCGKYGKLGHQDQVDQLKPKHIRHFQKGKKSTLNLRAGGSSKQLNEDGQVNDQDSQNIQDFDNYSDDEHRKRMSNSSQISNGACSKSCTLLVQKGKIYTVGRNHYGLLGYQVQYNQPFTQELKQITSLGLGRVHIEGVAAGQNHCLAWAQNGRIYSWGKSSDGCLGYLEKSIGGGYIQTEPRLIESLVQYDISIACAGLKHSIALTNCGKIFHLNDFFEPMNPFDQSRFKGLDLFFLGVSSGDTHCAAVSSLGALYMWGESTDGCLGRPPPESNPKQISLMPLEVDFFNDKRVHQVSCGEKFTIVSVIDRKDQKYLAKRNQEENRNTHISNALRKKLMRRISFKQDQAINFIKYSKLKHDYSAAHKKQQRKDLQNTQQMSLSNTLKLQQQQELFADKFKQEFTNYIGSNQDLVEKLRTAALRSQTPFQKRSNRFEHFINPLETPLEDQSLKTKQYYDQLLGNSRSPLKQQSPDKTRPGTSQATGAQRDELFVKQPSKMLQRRIKTKQILLSDSLKFSHRDTQQSQSQMFTSRPSTQQSLTSKKQVGGASQIKELISTLYNSNIETVFDDVNQKINERYNEGALSQTNFYYYNIVQNREEFNRELKFKRQKEIAERHYMPHAEKIMQQIAGQALTNTNPKDILNQMKQQNEYNNINLDDQQLVPQSARMPQRSNYFGYQNNQNDTMFLQRQQMQSQQQLQRNNLNQDGGYGMFGQSNGFSQTQTHFKQNYGGRQITPSSYQRFNRQSQLNVASKERLSSLIKMKEDIELQSQSLKKIMLMKKIEEVNNRKNILLVRKKAEYVKSGLLKYGLKQSYDQQNFNHSKASSPLKVPQQCQTMVNEISDEVKLEIFKMQKHIIKRWLSILVVNQALQGINQEYQERVIQKYKNSRNRRR